MAVAGFYLTSALGVTVALEVRAIFWGGFRAPPTIERCKIEITEGKTLGVKKIWKPYIEPCRYTYILRHHNRIYPIHARHPPVALPSGCGHSAERIFSNYLVSPARLWFV